MSTYQCDKVIEGVECCSNNSLYQIDKDRLIASGTLNSFCIVNIDTCVIEKTIKIWKSNPPYSDTPFKVLEFFCISKRKI